jgi:hypothetical protein
MLRLTGEPLQDVRRRNLALRHPVHGEFLALFGAVEKIKIDQLLVRKAGLIRQAFGCSALACSALFGGKMKL